MDDYFEQAEISKHNLSTVRRLIRAVLTDAEIFPSDNNGNAPLTAEMERKLNEAIEIINKTGH